MIYHPGEGILGSIIRSATDQREKHYYVASNGILRSHLPVRVSSAGVHRLLSSIKHLCFRSKQPKACMILVKVISLHHYSASLVFANNPHICPMYMSIVQVLNDLLDPSRANLKLREDPKRGFYVEGIKEETLVSAEHALSVIATGVAHRKVRPRTIPFLFFPEKASAVHSSCLVASGLSRM